MKLSELVIKEIKGIWGDEPKPGDRVTPVIKTNDMSYEGYISFSNLTYRTIPENKLTNSYLSTGDLLIEKSGGTKTHSVGYVNIFEGEPNKYVCNNFILALRLNDKIVMPKYLFYQLKYKYESGLFSDCYNKTTGIQNLQVKTYLSKDVVIHNYAEQKRIIDELDEITSLIHSNKNKIDILNESIKSRFIELFMDGDKDKYPLSKWEEVVTIKHGKDYKKNVAESGGYPVYGSGGFMGVYANNYLVNENATIIGRKGTIDKPIFVNEKFWNVDTAFGIEVNKKILNPLFFFIRSTLYDLKAFSTSTTLPSMTKDTLHKITIGIPPLELQNKFAGFVIQIDKSKFVVQKQIKDLKELLDKKMDEYFGG